MKIKNKRVSKQWVQYDRSLMRDKRLKSNHKQIYLLFCSLSESCNTVYPSYAWIAEEVGYEYNGKYEVGSKQYEWAMKKFVQENIQPLIDLGWIKKTNINGQSCDYEVYDHDCDRGEKTPHPVEKKVHGTVEKKVHVDKREELQELDRDFYRNNWSKFDSYESLKEHVRKNGLKMQDIVYQLPVNAFSLWGLDYTETINSL